MFIPPHLSESTVTVVIELSFQEYVENEILDKLLKMLLLGWKKNKTKLVVFFTISKFHIIGATVRQLCHKRGQDENRPKMPFLLFYMRATQ